MAEARRDPRQEAALRALREALAMAAREAGAAQAHLQTETTRFHEVGRRAIGVVGGSAQRVDQELTQSLEEAAHQTGAAVAALGAAMSATRSAS